MIKNVITHFESGVPDTLKNTSNGYALGQDYVDTNTGLKYYQKSNGVWVSVAIKHLEYTVLISQVGMSSPTAIVLENNLGATVTLNRSVIGIYSVVFSSNVLTTGKTTVVINNSDTSNGRTTYAKVVGTSAVQIVTRAFGATIDDVLDNTTLEIKVYQ